MTFSYKQNSLGGFFSNRKNSSTDWSWTEEYDSDEEKAKKKEEANTYKKVEPQSDDDPLGSHIADKVEVGIHNLGVKHYNIRGLLSEASSFTSGVSRDLESASYFNSHPLDFNQKGKAIVNQLFKSKDYWSNKAATGARIIGDELNIDPRISSLFGMAAFETLTDIGVSKLAAGANKFTQGTPPGMQLATVDNVVQPGLIKGYTQDVLSNKPLQARVTPEMAIQKAKTGKIVTRTIKGMKGSEAWTQGAYNHYIKGLKNNLSAPMEGYPNFKTPDGRIIRATPGKNGALTFIDEAKKAASRKARYMTQEAWKIELKSVLEEFGMSDKFDELSKIITKGNKVQSDRVTRFNKALKNKGITDLREHFTVEHIGALKNKWPDVPENRWGIIKRKLNSKAGALKDSPELNTRLSGTPRDLREWVIKQELGDLDITESLPIKIRRQILKATHKKGPLKGQADVEKIDQIFTDYFQSIE